MIIMFTLTHKLDEQSWKKLEFDERTITRTIERLLEFDMLKKDEFGKMKVTFEEEIQ